MSCVHHCGVVGISLSGECKINSQFSVELFRVSRRILPVFDV